MKAAAGLPRLSKASEDRGHEKASDSPSADPSPAATRLLRGLLGDAVPREPPASASSGAEQALWWKCVVDSLDAQKRQPVLHSLELVQRRALRAVSKKARASSSEAMPKLHRRFLGMGLFDADLRLALAWVLAAAPIIIHVDLKSTLQYLLKATHYRNQFECVHVSQQQQNGRKIKPLLHE